MTKHTHCSAEYEPFIGETVRFRMDVPTPYAPGVILDEIRRVVNEGLRVAMHDARVEYGALEQAETEADADTE